MAGGAHVAVAGVGTPTPAKRPMRVGSSIGHGLSVHGPIAMRLGKLAARQSVTLMNE